ncbi:hypothetical protein BOW53_12930 [Solemya pervernicosa gill symbiont]|uniref:Mannosyl-glycoprotein endo-beta-N-acetylglucosamidase-like domain-containing protein n=2 Tax=Gammaproteobacteria incertae sedis TaxID=118884 RepID=A0A1T2L212_9GAMM|nr:hypothetical protein BOW53_12930 [Solemya pervernicosa gill symbiont]
MTQTSVWAERYYPQRVAYTGYPAYVAPVNYAPQSYYSPYRYRYGGYPYPTPPAQQLKSKALGKTVNPAKRPSKMKSDAKGAVNHPPVIVQKSGGKKTTFINKLVPLVEVENRRIAEVRAELITLFDSVAAGGVLTDGELNRIHKIAKQYRVKGDPLSQREALLQRVDIIPVELALAQAANESAWGESRFAREALNLFGIWTYDASKGLVPKGRSEGQKHLVRKYDSLGESVRHYLNLLNSHSAYQPLREIRAELRRSGGELDGALMAAGLVRYSAKGDEYVKIIRSIISTNELERFRQPVSSS